MGERLWSCGGCAGWYERHGESGPELVNMYGITETTVHVSYARLTAEMVKGRRGSVIGGNIADLRIYVLDQIWSRWRREWWESCMWEERGWRGDI